MSDSLWLKEEQLLWFDELNPDYFVEVRAQRMGEDDFREDALLTQMLRLNDLTAFRTAHIEHNLWRSWSVFRDIGKQDVVGPVPLIFDKVFTLR